MCNDGDMEMKLFFILLIVVLGILLIGTIFCVEIPYVYKQTSQEKKIVQSYLMIVFKYIIINLMTQFICVMILSIFFVLLCKASECESLIQEFSIIGTMNESFSWDLHKAFFRGSDLKSNVSLSCMAFFGTSDPIQQLGYSTNHGDEDIGVILTLNPLVNQESSLQILINLKYCSILKVLLKNKSMLSISIFQIILTYTQHLVLAYKNKVVVFENFIQKQTFQLPHLAVYGELS